MNIANALTTSRLVFAPLFLIILLLGHTAVAFVVFCIAGFTDLIDGTIARRYGKPTRYGSVIDPLADKLLLGTCFVSLAIFGVVPTWFAILAVGRDVMIMGGICYLTVIKAPLLYRATLISKFATFLQLATAILGLIVLWKGELDLAMPMRMMVYLTTVFLMMTGIHYIWIGVGLRKKRVVDSNSDI